MEFDYSPAWKDVAQYMRWTEPLENLADIYVRKTIGVTDDQPTPPVSTFTNQLVSALTHSSQWITIHVRHADFANWCGDVPLKDCFASIPIIARRVHEVQEELRERKGIVVEHVIMTSDEKDPDWWAEVTEQGWLGVDHSRTTELYGAWYAESALYRYAVLTVPAFWHYRYGLFIDAVIQSGGEGFVGTDRSTMSMMARRRVQSWREGAVRTVKWGQPNSDDH